MSDLTPAQKDAAHRIGMLLQELADLVGPSFDGDVDEGVPMRQPILVSWVLVANWEDANPDDVDESGSIVRMGSVGLRRAERTGLLHEALFGMD